VRATLRCLIIVVTILSWIAISNHCALRAFAAKSQTTSSCPFHSKPAKPQPKSSATECCKILRATAPTLAKNPAPAVADFSFGGFIVVAPPEVSFAQATLDTGPPGKTSFTELSPSLRAHAPPFRA
jgi:hypothetical protein